MRTIYIQSNTLRNSLLGIVIALGIIFYSEEAKGYYKDFTRGLLDYAYNRFGNQAPQRLQNMHAAVRQIKSSTVNEIEKTEKPSGITTSELAILGQVNEYFNRQQYMSDKQHWGVDDYWATPVEFVGGAAGDCEDYTIAKYLALKYLGIPVDRLRISYVRALKFNEAHMVLAYYPTTNAEPWILDNLLPEVKLASARNDLVPVYSFNDDDVWLPNGINSKGGASNVRLWRDLQEKILKEKKL